MAAGDPLLVVPSLADGDGTTVSCLLKVALRKEEEEEEKRIRRLRIGRRRRFSL